MRSAAVHVPQLTTRVQGSAKPRFPHVLLPSIYVQQYIFSSTWMSFGLYSVHLLEQIYLWRFFVARYLLSEMIFTRWIHTYKFIIISIGGPPGLESFIRPAKPYQVWRSAASSAKSVLVLRSTAYLYGVLQIHETSQFIYKSVKIH